MINKPRNRWLTAFLTLFTMGLGHVYCGELKRGIIFFILHFIIINLSFLLLKFYPSLTNLGIVASLLLMFFLVCLIDALIISKRKLFSYNLKSYNKWYVYIAIILVFVILPRPLTRSYIKENIAKTFYIPAGSMTPTLLIGDMLLAKMDPISKSNINKGEIIIFKYPEDPSRVFVKRVIATEGEKLSIQNKQVLVNNINLDEPYVINSDPRILSNDSIPRDNFGSVIVPEKSFFVMGDNRDESYDSRFWGFVKQSDIIGKAALLFWSWDNINKKIRWDRIGEKLN